MLIEFTVGNFRSFRDKVTLSMVASKLKSKDAEVDANNQFDLPGQPALLTSAAVYGANASGKSNLVLALDFMRAFVLRSQRGNQALGAIQAEPFRLNTTTIHQPSHFEIVFIADDGKRYRYGFEVTHERVTSEWLYTVPTIREALLFERTMDEFKLGERFAEGSEVTRLTRPNALLLSVVAQFNGQIALRLLMWFRRLSVSAGLNDASFTRSTIRQMLSVDDLPSSRAIVALVRALDVGIDDIEVVKRPYEATLNQPVLFSQADIENVEVPRSVGRDRTRVETLHAMYDQAGQAVAVQRFQLEREESAGTQKLFALAGPLISTLRQGEVLVIDEMDARLHPLLTQALIGLFNDPQTNPNHAQLILTTHDINLLDLALFRRDQIWFVEKDAQGSSSLFSLAEFRERNDRDIERAYMSGRYGAIPYLGKLRYLREAIDAAQ